MYIYIIYIGKYKYILYIIYIKGKTFLQKSSFTVEHY